MALPQNRQERNIISTTVSENLPDFVRQDHPTFLKFVETYYEWLESSDNAYFAPLSLNGVVDIDKTSTEFIKYFKTHTMNKFPENFKSVKGDTLDIKKILKKIRSFYLAKGTESSIEFLIRLLFDVYVETYRPAEDIFKSSGGFWYGPTVVRCTDSNPIENSKTRGQRVEFIDNGNIIGTAVVDDIHQFVMSGHSVMEIELVEISDVSLTDTSVIKITKPDGTKITESLYSLVVDVPISSAGKLYTVDDDVSLTGTIGTDFRGSVQSIDKDGAIRKIRIDEPGLNYTSEGNHTASVKTTTGTGAIFGSPSYGYIFTKPGVYLNNDGKLSSTEFLQDNFRYQMHSYVIRTEASLSEYESVLKDLVHPAGKKVLGDYFVYRKDFGPSAGFVGYKHQQLYSPFFANYFPYSLATLSDGGLTGTNNGDFGVVDSSIDLRGVCAASISNNPTFGDLYYDFFPFGYDGSTGYTLDFVERTTKTPKTPLGDGISLGWAKQDFNKFGGLSATQEFFSKQNVGSILIEEINFADRTDDPSRSYHIENSFVNGDLVYQISADGGSTHATGLVWGNDWSTNLGTFKVLRTSGHPNGFRTTSNPSLPDSRQTDAPAWKIINDTASRDGRSPGSSDGTPYTGGTDYRQNLYFAAAIGDPTGDAAMRSDYVNFFRVDDHVYQGWTGSLGSTAYGKVISWEVDVGGTAAGCTLTLKLFGVETEPDPFLSIGFFPSTPLSALHRLKGPNHSGPTITLPDSGSTSGGETFIGGGHTGMAFAGLYNDALITSNFAPANNEYGGFIESVTVLDTDSVVGSTLPGWPHNGIDFWIVHPHPNTWHGNIPFGVTWGGITIQSFIKSEYKLTSPPVYGTTGESSGSLNQSSNNNIPGGYGS